MAQFGCSKGHQWLDTWEPGCGTLPPSCPLCQTKDMERIAELKELKQVIKEAVLEALNEQPSATKGEG